MLATIPEEAARKVADDIRTYGRGYIRIDAEGRAEYVPPYMVLAPEPLDRRVRE